MFPELLWEHGKANVSAMVGNGAWPLRSFLSKERFRRPDF
jgi:hypothetical protein